MLHIKSAIAILGKFAMIQNILAPDGDITPDVGLRGHSCGQVEFKRESYVK